MAHPVQELLSSQHHVAAASGPGDFWLDLQDHKGSPRGFAPYIDNNFTYPVYRNAVTGYGAQNDNTGDQAGTPQALGPLQHAMNDDGVGGSRYQAGTSIEPAVLFLPPGTYQLKHPLDLRMNTVILGDPQNPPIISAAPDFDEQADTLVNGTDSATGHPEDCFLTILKNVILDTTNLPNRTFNALQWGVAQACGLTNVQIRMPDNSPKHTGIRLSGGSTIAVTDVSIFGGLVGIDNSNQQVTFKNISFKNCTTAYATNGGGGFTSLLQGATFDTCSIGADISSSHTTNSGSIIYHGSLVLLDCISSNSGPVLKFHDSSNDGGLRNNQVAIENLTVTSVGDPKNPPPIAIDEHGNPKLPFSPHTDTWIFGNLEPGVYQAGTPLTTQRAPVLLKDGKFFTKAQPSYIGESVDQFVNVKAVLGHQVFGDGSTDDSSSLNAILVQNAAAGKISYFPYGVYIVEDTLFVPPGSRIVGEAWSVISGKGAKFQSVTAPKPVVQVGKPDDKGVAEIQEMRFAVAEPCPGAIIVQVNMAGNPGDVGIWNCLVTIGGTKDTQVSVDCVNSTVTNLRAAFMAMHLTTSSSTYVENVWGWAADHNIDGGPPLFICSGRGLLVESTKATWLVGTGFEHHWLYNYNFHNAQNVFAGLLQAETPYFQGIGAHNTVPDPWEPDSTFGDPDYLWCGPFDQMGRTCLAMNIDGGSNLALYNTAFWAFFHGPEGFIADDPIQTNMIRVANSPQNLVIYAINVKGAAVLVFDSRGNPSQEFHPGSWDGSVIAYRTFAA